MQIPDLLPQAPESGKTHGALTDLLTELVFRARIQPDCALEYVNAGVTRLIGYTPQELYAAPVLSERVVHPEDLPLIWQLLDAADDCDAMNCRLRLLHKNGSVIHTEQIWTIERDEFGRAAVIAGVVSDVTQSVSLSVFEAECELLAGEVGKLNDALAQRVAELGAALGELRRAERLKTEFLAAISHELRTPLVGILGAADALSVPSGDPLTARQQRRVAMIQNEGERLLKLIDGLLHYADLLARKTPLHVRPCHLISVGEKSIRTIAPLAAAKSLHVTFSVNPPELSIMSDDLAIDGILNALLENAVKFTLAGGQIALDIDAAGCEALLRVTDTGIGMIPEQIESLFAPFVQGDGSLSRSYGGMGLGLAFVARMTEALGGRLAVKSELGRGTQVCVYLPTDSAPPGGAHMG